MDYEEPLKRVVAALVAAGEAGRTNPGGMLGPLDMAIVGMTVAADELDKQSSLDPDRAKKLQRTMRAVNAAESIARQMAMKPGAGPTAIERMGTFAGQSTRAGAAVNRIAGRIAPIVNNILPSRTFGGVSPLAEAVKPFPHLLIIQTLEPNAKPYYFNLDTAAFDEVRRRTASRWAGQERLTRDIAQQAVGHGEDQLTLKGAIFPLFKGGIRQLDTLRSMARRLLPLSLTTGYGDVLGTWCLTNIEEEQSALLAGGIPRKQGFTLEFVKYGNDLQNV